MKNLALTIYRLFLIAALAALTSCVREKPRDSVEFSDTSIVVEAGEISYQFDVVSNSYWTLSCQDSEGNQADWFSVTPSSGNGSARVTLNILKENTSLASREGKIVASCGKRVSEAKVIYRGVAQVFSYIDPKTVAVSSSAATSGRFTLVLSSTGANATATAPSDVEWISNLKLIQDESDGRSNRKTWSFDIADNTMSDSRNAEIKVTVSAKGKSEDFHVKIEQSGLGVPSLKTPDVVYMGSEQSIHTQPFWIDGSKENLTYRISCASVSSDTGEPWIQDARIDGESLVITALPNTFSESREGSVYIVGTRSSGSGAGASTTLSVKVYQAGHSSAGILLAASEVNVGSADASHYISFVLLNGSKIKGDPEANVPWISNIEVSEEGRLSYKVSAFNASSDELDFREGIISFAVDNGSSNSALATLKVRQYSSKFTDIVLPAEISLGSKYARAVIPFDAFGGDVEVLDNEIDWLTATVSETDGMSFVKISADDRAAGDADAELRSGLVSLKYTKNGKTAYHYINVYQLAPSIRDISVPEVLNLDYDDESVSFTVSLNGGTLGTINCTSSGGWVKSATVQNAGNDSAEITVEVDRWSTATDGQMNRNGLVCIPYVNDGVTIYHYVQINQKSKVFSDIELPQEITLPAKFAIGLIPFDAAGGELEVVNLDYSEYWIYSASFPFENDSFLMVYADDWTAADADSESRSAIVFLKYTKDGKSVYHYLTVRQLAPAIRDIVVPSAIDMDYYETSTSFRLALNGGEIGDISYSSSGNWIKKVRVVENGDNLVDVVVETESWVGSGHVTSDRSGTLCIPYKYDGLTMYHYVKVSQKPEPFTDIYVPGHLSLQQTSGPFTFYLDASKGRIGNVTSTADWLTVTSSTNKGICSVTIAAANLGDSDPSRQCVLAVPYTMNGISVIYYINVAQYSKSMSALSSFPTIISMSYSQTGYEWSEFNTAETGCKLGKASWTSEDGWLTKATVTGTGGVIGEKLLLESSAMDQSISSPFRMGLVSYPFTKGSETVFYYVPVYQYAPSTVGINIPSSINIEPYDVSTTINLNGVDGATLTASESVDWITSVDTSPHQVTIHTTTAYISGSSEPTRSAVITFTYTVDGISTSYMTTVTQDIMNEPVGILDEIPMGYRNYAWRSSKSESPQYQYSSFKWLENSDAARTADVGLFFLGVASSYDFVGNNQSIPCSDDSLLKAKMISCDHKTDADGNSYMEAVIRFSDLDLRGWVPGKEYSLTIAVDGGTMTVPFTINVYDHQPVKLDAMRDIVPEVTGNTGRHDTPTFDLGGLACPPGEEYSSVTIDGIFSDRECTVSKTSEEITSLQVLTSADKPYIRMTYNVNHRHEEGFIKLMLHTASGKTEVLSIPYRLYSSISASGTLRINSRVYETASIFGNLDDWTIERIECMTNVGGSDFRINQIDGGSNLLAEWKNTMPTEATAIFHFKLKSPYGTDSMKNPYKIEVHLNGTVHHPLLPGVFSIGSGEMVRFTSGMLLAKRERDWGFSILTQDQEPLGQGGANTSLSTALGSRRDLFFFSASFPLNYGLTSPTPLLSPLNSFKDWGGLFPGEGYKSLTANEWRYLMGSSLSVKVDGSVIANQSRAFFANYNGDKYLVLLPDSFEWNSKSMGQYDKRSSADNTCCEFAAMEDAGAVFLPYNAGYIIGDRFEKGCMFFAIEANVSGITTVWIREAGGGTFNISTATGNLGTRCPVRLVKPL